MLFMKLNKFLSIGEFTNPKLGKRGGRGFSPHARVIQVR